MCYRPYNRHFVNRRSVLVDHLNGYRAVTIADATIVRIRASQVLPRKVSAGSAIECNETLARLDSVERNHIVWNAVSHQEHVRNGEGNRPSGRAGGTSRARHARRGRAALTGCTGWYGYSGGTGAVYQNLVHSGRIAGALGNFQRQADLTCTCIVERQWLRSSKILAAIGSKRDRRWHDLHGGYHRVLRLQQSRPHFRHRRLSGCVGCR